MYVWNALCMNKHYRPIRSAGYAVSGKGQPQTPLPIRDTFTTL